MDKSEVIERIRHLGNEVLPEGSSLWLYGSRARDVFRPESDWDLLILLNKSKISSSDYDFVYPFRELGWMIGEEINPHIYSKQQWDSWTFLPYFKNVEQDKIVLV